MLQRQSTCLALNKHFPPANLGKDALHRLLPMLPNIQVAFDRLLPPILTETWKKVFIFLIFLPSLYHRDQKMAKALSWNATIANNLANRGPLRGPDCGEGYGRCLKRDVSGTLQCIAALYFYEIWLKKIQMTMKEII